jgi:hypothetical protein
VVELVLSSELRSNQHLCQWQENPKIDLKNLQARKERQWEKNLAKAKVDCWINSCQLIVYKGCRGSVSIKVISCQPDSSSNYKKIKNKK